MKLASYMDGSRDGQLLVVSRDLGSAHYATGIATRLQQVLDDWNFLSPQLEALSNELNHGRARHAFAFDPQRCAAPLPRSFLRAQGDGTAPPRVLRGDALLGPGDLIEAPAATEGEDGGLDVEVQTAVVAGDLAAGTDPDAALESIRLVGLACGVVLRGAQDADLGCALSPVLVTPDELGPAWERGRAFLPLDIQRNGKRFGLVDAGQGMAAHFGALLAALARRRGLRAGALVCAGPLASDGTRGHASVAACRALEADRGDATLTDWLQPGDTLRVDARGRDGPSVFGALTLAVASPEAAPAAPA
jgi:fumarylacetoacetate (FAA) hydrolase